VSLIARSHRLYKWYIAADINRLDRPPGWHRYRFCNAEILEDRMASARLAIIDAIGSYRLQGPDPPARGFARMASSVLSARGNTLSALVD
jgi:hypothetical protein